MDISYHYHLERGYILTKASGSTTLKALELHVDRLIQDPLLSTPYVEIFDFTETIDFDFGYKESSQIGKKYLQLKKNLNYRGIIFIAESDYQKAMSNVFKVKAEDFNITIKIVANFKEAILELNRFELDLS